MKITVTIATLLLAASMLGGCSVTKQGSDSTSASSSGVSSSQSSKESSSSSQEKSESSSEESSEEASEVDLSGDNSWQLMLINKTNLLSEDYKPKLASVVGDYKFDSRAVDDLKQMIRDAEEAGVPLALVSAYRSPARSQELYTNKIQTLINQEGYDKEAAAVEAGKWIAPPYTSEHNSGLAVDIVSSDYYTKYDDLYHEFEEFPAFDWLSENCAEYGFILRYPKDKEDITEITYEPWHYRYVGKENAKKIQESGLCLEEYLAQ